MSEAALLKMKDQNQLGNKNKPWSISIDKVSSVNNIDVPEGENKAEDKENCCTLEDDDLQILDNPGSATTPTEKDSNISPSDQQKKKRPCDLFVSKSLRLKSYVRRRPIPLKRLTELDAQCGTKSFIVQILEEMGEAIYTGHPDLVKCFTSDSGLKLSDVNNLLVSGRYQARPKGTKQNWEHDYNPAGPEETTDNEDEDFFQTLKAKRQAESAKQAAKKNSSMEFIKNCSDRQKKIKVQKDGIFCKVKEIDQVSGSFSFVVVCNYDRDTCYYYGTPSLLALFFTTGIKYDDMLANMNVRSYDLNEEMFNTCVVPNCVVSRNTLAKWRLVAIDRFGFPRQLAVTLHPCPEEERDKWMAEIDLDPNFKAKVAVCSFHFKDGQPTAENPYPSQLLGAGFGPQYFCGKPPKIEVTQESMSQIIREFCSTLVETHIMNDVNKHIEIIEKQREQQEKIRKEREEKRKKELLIMKTIKFLKFSPLRVKKDKKKKRLKRGRLSAKLSTSVVDKGEHVHRVYSQIKFLRQRLKCRQQRIKCRFCPKSFPYTKYLFNHVRNVHVTPVVRHEVKEWIVPPEEEARILQALYPKTPVLNHNKKYVCAVCKTVTTLLGLFMHMREVHHGMLCQYCLKMFKRVKDLENHLEVHHQNSARYYSNFETFNKYSGGHHTMVCYDCGVPMTVKEAETHSCSTNLHLTCSFCHAVFRTQDDLELHIVRGDCRHGRAKLYSKHQYFNTNHKQDDQGNAKTLYKVLTGKNLPIDHNSNKQLDTTDLLDIDINTLLQVDMSQPAQNKQVSSNTQAVTSHEPAKPTFSCFDRTALSRYLPFPFKSSLPPKFGAVLLPNVPSLGQIFSGTRAKGITNNVKKEFKDCGHMFSITNEIDEALKEKDDTKEEVSSLVDSSILSLRIERAGKNFIIDDSRKRPSGDDNEPNSDTDDAMEPLIKSPVVPLPKRPASKRTVKPTMKIQGATQPADITPPAQSITAKGITALPVVVQQKPDKAKLESRTDRIARMELEITENVRKMRRIIDKFVTCLFCQQCKTVSVDVTFLLSHFHIHHLQDGVNNIMGETAQNCIQRVKKYLKDTKRKEVLFNYCPREELFVLEFYRCSYCPTTECKEYSDLFQHTETIHQTKILTCNICRNIFLNYGSLISHVCTGPPTSNATRARFACKVCLRVDLHSFLEFQSHIRKEHNICEICFTSSKDQESLLKHCTSHDQDMMCMKCFVTFEKAISFRKHLFFKHSGEQKECLSCHCPTWPHVYHFCLPDNPIPCHNCDMTLANAAAFKVHSRKHQGVTPHVCTQPNCNRSYISKSLLWKHQVRRHPQLQPVVSQLLRRRKLKQDVTKFCAQEVDSLDICLQVLDLVWDGVCKKIEELEPPDIEPETEKKTTTPEVTEISVLDAAIRSIMPESEDESKAMDTAALQESDRNAVQSTIAEKAYTEDNSWQAGIDALLAGASMKMPKVPAPSDLPPDQLFQNTDQEDGAVGTGTATKPIPGEGPKAPVIGGLWNQDLIFVGNKDGQDADGPQKRQAGRANTRGGVHSRGGGHATTHNELYSPQRPTGTGPRVRGRGARTLVPRAIRTNFGVAAAHPPKKSEFDLNLSESSDDEADNTSRRLLYTSVSSYKSLMDHDYCYAAFMMGQEPPEDTREMDKIVSNVTFDQFGDSFEPEQHEDLSYMEEEQNVSQVNEQPQPVTASAKRPESSASSDTSSADESPEKMNENVDMFGMAARRQLTSTPAVPSASTPYVQNNSNEYNDTKYESGLPLASPALTPFLKRGPKPKYHTPDVAKYSGVTAGTARPSFDTDSSKGSDTEDGSDSDDDTSCDDIATSDLDTDFSADESIVPKSNSPKGKAKSSATKAKPNIKLKIKLPPQKTKDGKSRRKKKRKSTANEEGGRPLSKKMRESLALNQRRASSEEEDGETSDDDKAGGDWAATANSGKQRVDGTKHKNGNTEDTKLYCYCQCPHDEYSEMIGCDAPDCRLEWFHFECVNILVPPEGKWFCPECTKRYGLM